jgi:hypothetical protein
MYLTVGNAIDPATGDARPLPQEYIEFRMCEHYHCLPSQLRREDWATVEQHLRFLDLRATTQQSRDGTSSSNTLNTLAPPPDTVDAAATLNVNSDTNQANHASAQYH